MKNRLFKRKKEEPVIVPPSLDCFPDFTKKEIFTQGELINELLERYIRADKIDFDYLKIKSDKIKRIYVVGSGVDYSCAIFGAYNFEVLLDVISAPMCTGEFVFSNPILDKGTLVIMIGDDKRVEKRIDGTGARLVRIIDYDDGIASVTLGYKTLGSFQSASYTLKLTALSLLALYLGEKNQIITTLYVKIATRMLVTLSEKIKKILSQEFIINELCQGISLDCAVFTGTNVDYAVSVYAQRVFSDIAQKSIACMPSDEMSAFNKENGGIIALASNIDFYNLLDSNASYQLKIAPCSVRAIDEKAFFYEETIPLLNPILSAVVIQLIAYKKLS